MRDQLAEIAREDSLRVEFPSVRPGTVSMRSKVRHDHPKAFHRDPVGMAELDPVHLRIGEEAVQQDDRSALTQFMIRQLDTVRCGPVVGGYLRQCECSQ